MSADTAFELLFREYARIVAGWLAVRVDPSAVDDLAQDVWLVFYGRFRRWEYGVERESPEARPILSFLFRTCQFVARGHQRLARSRRGEPLGDRESLPSAGATDAEKERSRDIDAGRALAVARRLCPEEELDVLLAKLSGFSAKEIADMLAVTPAVVDHRYRDALARLRKEMKVRSGPDERGKKRHG
jgi:DNA-directed RNA polymerase specialized sigma24 family protein